MSKLRDSFGRLFSKLIGDGEGEGEIDFDDGDERASARLLSNAILNFATVVGPAGIARLEAALPWVGALAAWHEDAQEDGADGDSMRELAETVRRAGGGLALGAAGIERRLSEALENENDDGTDGDRASIVDGLARAARDDRRLRSTGDLSDGELAAAAVEKTELMRLVVEVGSSGTPAGFASRFEELFPFGPSLDRAARGRRRALEMLAALEEGRLATLCEIDGFAKSTSRFEVSLARHMDRRGMSRAVRVALAFGSGTMTGAGAETAPASSLSSWLRLVSRSDGQGGWVALARALVENRWRFVRCLAGESPRSGLDSWAGFLRRGCGRLADREEISEREAVHYAHYTMHLMNVCDLGALTGGAVSDEMRSELFELENDVKNAVLSGDEARPRRHTHQTPAVLTDAQGNVIGKGVRTEN